MTRTERKLDVGQRMIEDGELLIRIGPEGETCMIQLYGELDLASVPTLERELQRAAGAASHTVVVDLSGLQFIDSTGISAFLRVARRAENGGRRCAFLRGSSEVERVLELSGASKVLRFLD